MRRKKNVLVTGIGQANYILQLYSKIGPRLDNFNFSSLNLKQFGDQEVRTVASKVFVSNLYTSFNFKNVFRLTKSLSAVLFNGYFWKDLRILLAEKGWRIFPTSFNLLLRHIDSYSYARFVDKNTQTDIIHLHVPRHRYALFLKYLKKRYEVIISYWGSDIFRIDNLHDHTIQNSSLNNARFITTTTPEMEFAVLTRYGFYLSEKMRRARFIHDNSYYESADKLSLKKDEGWQEDYKKSLNIDPSKIVILFGHNAHRENNHVKFLEVLKDLPGDIVSQFHIIFPWTYGDNEKKYIDELYSIIAEIPASFSFLKEFMNWDELARLKKISDVYIHCPTTDGLSAFLTEFFYTENLAIVGEWLPYKTFKNFGIYYSTFQDFGELKDLLSNLKVQLEDSQDLRAKNRDIVARNFDISKISNEWVKIFKELEDSAKGE